jgi:hypothetical protein
LHIPNVITFYINGEAYSNYSSNKREKWKSSSLGCP